jgi:phosphohistidine phosphatase
MKTLYLIRHAKSDWGLDQLSDIERPLNARGYSDANKMSLILKDKKIIPDIIISSPAIRAISTALIFCRNLNQDPNIIKINQKLYDSSVKDYINCILKTNNKFQTAFIFGHNPIISNTANELKSDVTDEIATCGIIGITSEKKDWKDFVTKKNTTTYFDFPKKQE